MVAIYRVKELALVVHVVIAAVILLPMAYFGLHVRDAGGTMASRW